MEEKTNNNNQPVFGTEQEKAADEQTTANDYSAVDDDERIMQYPDDEQQQNEDEWHDNDEQDKNHTSKRGLLSLAGDALFAPGKAFDNINDDPPAAYGVLIYTVVSVASLLLYLITLTGDFSGEFGSAILQLLPGIFIAGLIGYYLIMLISSAILHLLAELLGGKGRAKAMLTVYCFAALPTIFMIPLEVLFNMTGLSLLLGGFVLSIANIVIWVWEIVILYSGIQSISGFSGKRAAWVIIIPIAVIFILFLTAVLMALAFGLSILGF